MKSLWFGAVNNNFRRFLKISPGPPSLPLDPPAPALLDLDHHGLDPLSGRLVVHRVRLPIQNPAPSAMPALAMLHKPPAHRPRRHQPQVWAAATQAHHRPAVRPRPPFTFTCHVASVDIKMDRLHQRTFCPKLSRRAPSARQLCTFGVRLGFVCASVGAQNPRFRVVNAGVTRTYRRGPRIKRPLLYQLSYAPFK